MRLFTAIDLPEEIRARVSRRVAELRPLANLRWSAVEDLHITTKFIGEWQKERLDEVKRALELVPKRGPISIAIRGLGWFPNPQSPRVFWAGVKGGEVLARLAADTDAAMFAIRVPKEVREYSPHLTLGRTRDGMSKESLNALRKAVASLESDEFGTFEADTHHLYLSREGGYTKLARVEL